MNLEIKKLHPDAKLPTRSTTYDAAYDIYALESGGIIGGSKAMIRTGISIRIPQLQAPFRVYGSMRSRSGLSARHNIEVGAGVIDQGFEGELCVILYNHSLDVREYFHYEKGDRIAQLVLEVHITPPVVEVKEFEELKDNDRVGGFGSTGK